MGHVVYATWVARQGEEDTVRVALEELAPLSHAEPGCRYYQPHVSPDEPQVFRVFEVYDDAAAFDAHRDSEHFQRIAVGRAIPALKDRTVEIYTTLDA